MIPCFKLLANREFKPAAPSQQRLPHLHAPTQSERQNAPFGLGTGGHTGNQVAAPIGGSARVIDSLCCPVGGRPA